jgi:beta-glucosidase
MLATAHRLTSDLGEAARLALAAGVDSELPRTAAYGSPLLAALDEGRIDEGLVDAAVTRMLRLKFRLGLFDRPYIDVPTVAQLDDLEADEARIAADLARRSLVLVANDGILPLARGSRRIAVVGPIADSARDLLGDYSHLVHMETLNEMRKQGNALGVGDHATVAAADELEGRGTVLDALRAAMPDADLRYEQGCGISDGTDEGIAAAADLARDADVAIVVIGERSGLTDDSTTGEFRDRRDLGFPGRQQELLDAVVATGTPVVLVVVSGRPLAIEQASRACAAILLAWVPGDAGPAAIADVLTGVVNPGGKLPISIPRNVGQVPVSYRHHPSGGHSQPKGDYVDGPTTPLWPFGFGLSYTTFELRDLRVDRRTLPTLGGWLSLSVDVVNTGERAGDEVVQVYARDETATVARPVLELRGYRRVSLAPGECRTVTFRVAAEQFCYTGADLRRVVEPGAITLSVGTSSADRPLSAAIELVGPVVEVVERHHYLTETTVG